jgi:hypothetical protein
MGRVRLVPCVRGCRGDRCCHRAAAAASYRESHLHVGRQRGQISRPMTRLQAVKARRVGTGDAREDEVMTKVTATGLCLRRFSID